MPWQQKPLVPHIIIVLYLAHGIGLISGKFPGHAKTSQFCQWYYFLWLHCTAIERKRNPSRKSRMSNVHTNI